MGLEQHLALPPNSVDRVTPTFYTVAFDTSPTFIIPMYIGPTVVSRNNFSAFLTKSFAISRGIPSRQLAYFTWIQKVGGLNYPQTLRNFLSSGGWDVLVEEEKQLMSRQYRSVKQHYTHLESPNKFFYNPKTELDVEVEFVLSGIHNDANATYAFDNYGDLSLPQTEKEFMQKIY